MTSGTGLNLQAAAQPFERAADMGADRGRADPQRVADFGGMDTLVVAGDSVGGQLAASVALARRDARQPLSAQLLLYPVTREGDEVWIDIERELAYDYDE